VDIGWFHTLKISIIKWGLWHLAVIEALHMTFGNRRRTFVWSVVACNELLLAAMWWACLHMAAPFMIPHLPNSKVLQKWNPQKL